jgi:DNA-binding transcriptional MerR regulator
MHQLSIGDVAKATGVAVSAIRYYEEQGLLPSADRQANNRRCFGAETVQAVVFIAACRKASMNLQSIRNLQIQLRKPDLPCEQATAIVTSAIQDISRQIAALQDARKHLSRVAIACSPALCTDRQGGCSVPETMCSPAKN